MEHAGSVCVPCLLVGAFSARAFLITLLSHHRPTQLIIKQPDELEAYVQMNLPSGCMLFTNSSMAAHLQRQAEALLAS